MHGYNAVLAPLLKLPHMPRCVYAKKPQATGLLIFGVQSLTLQKASGNSLHKVLTCR